MYIATIKDSQAYIAFFTNNQVTLRRNLKHRRQNPPLASKSKTQGIEYILDIFDRSYRKLACQQIGKVVSDSSWTSPNPETSSREATRSKYATFGKYV